MNTFNALTLRAPWIAVGALLLASALIPLTITWYQVTPRIADALYLGIIATFIFLGSVLGFPLRQLRRWEAAPLVPRLLTLNAIAAIVALIGIWSVWGWAFYAATLTQPALAVPLAASALGLWGAAGVARPFDLVANVIYALSVPFALTSSAWAYHPLATPVAMAISVAVFCIVGRGIRTPLTPRQALADRSPGLRHLLAAFPERKPAKTPAEHRRSATSMRPSLRLARALGASPAATWVVAIGLATGALAFALIQLTILGTAPLLTLARLLMLSAVATLGLPILYYLRGRTVLARLWLTGSFTSRTRFGYAVVWAWLAPAYRATLIHMIVIGGFSIALDLPSRAVLLAALSLAATPILLHITLQAAPENPFSSAKTLLGFALAACVVAAQSYSVLPIFALRDMTVLAAGTAVVAIGAVSTRSAARLLMRQN